jgi:LytR cell envelope-related transcriptional attenuator
MKRRRGNTKLSAGASRLVSASVLLVVLLFAGILVYSMLDRFLMHPPAESERADNDSPTRIEKIIQISVRNECGTNDVAMNFTNFLRRRGFDVVETTNGTVFDRKFTAVVNTSGDYKNALRVAEALGVKKENVVTELDPRSYVDVEVLIGEDYGNLKPKTGIE